ncbi:glycosyltransferase [Bifidobacterium tibiigranuli]|uniref:glycosyltransferase n=1 Tax=Bifidobacterium tibiigranuli TaxID=2172043 RepID=UPI0026EAD587|nr:glycosyltransferase [Bifidobacterium tibiigranuli]MCI1713964.1 glycosyltransferase [Bifidobacterium tibiigranuli]
MTLIEKNEDNLIRVLHVVPNMQQGGLENYIMNIYRNIDRNKVQFDFLEHYSKDYFFDDEIRDLGGHIYRIPFMEDKKNITGYNRELRTFFGKNRGFNIVHGHMATTAMFYLKVAEKFGVDNRIIHAHEDSYIKNPRGIMRMMLIKQAWRHANILLACSRTSGQYYYGDRHFEVMKNAIDSKRFTFNAEERKRFRHALGIADSTLVIGHIGRFSLQKNHRFLIDIFQSVLHIHPDAVLLMVGTGETQDDIRTLVAENNLESRIRFIDPMSNPESAYDAMDIFVLPSFFEGLPLTGIEAQCNGLPCVFSDMVTSEVDLGNAVSFCGLDKESSVWADAVLKQSLEGYGNRVQNVKAVREQGYDANLNAQRMQDFYRRLVS